MKYELPEDKIEIFNSNSEKANRLSKEIIIIKGKPNAKLGFWNKRKAKKAIQHYTTCLNLLPNHWQTHWRIAKVYQAMLEHKKALYHFEIAIDIEKTIPDLPREASISAMDAGEINLAVKYSHEALNRQPNDSGLCCNHAINLMVLGDDIEAMNWMKKAIELDPDDEINKNALSLIKAVAIGQMKRPNYNELG